MAKEEVVRRRRKHSSGGGKGTHRHKDGVRRHLPDEPAESLFVANCRPRDVDELRSARLSYLQKTPTERQMLSMKFVGETASKVPSTKLGPHYRRKVKRRHSSADPERTRRRKSRDDEDVATSSDLVYGSREDMKRHDKVQNAGARKHGLPTVMEETSGSESSEPRTSRKRKIRDLELRRRSDGPPRPYEEWEPKSSHRASGSLLRLGVPRQSSPRRQDGPTNIRRASSAHESLFSSRPGLQRSSTAVQSRAQSMVRMSPKRSSTTPSVISKDEKRTPSVISSFLKGPPPRTSPSEKKVQCLTCFDDIPVSRTARLACLHRMCHGCLKRIFNMSVTDPAHMPPKCCTDEHIPLKHVDKLFDQKFKVKWNKKFQEYTTNNRLYCPSKGCGEWIKPNHISVDQGRKVGKCKRCGMKVCATCNNRMHISKECPKDEATKQFVEVAKKEGWQRCYNCKAMVELKEGCNHMTCRCTAQFCMICGNRWKTCDCPWFNYETAEADRLLHMNVPQFRRPFPDADGRAPIRYQEEMDRRREQELRDEALARRLQVLGVDDAGDLAGQPNQMNVYGIGNAAGHFVNQDFRQQARELLSGNFRAAARAAEGLLNGTITGRENPLPPAPFEASPTPQHDTPPNQSPRLLRQHSSASRAYNTTPTVRPSERVVPGRRTSDYAAEAARHAPAGRMPSNPPPSPARRASTRHPNPRAPPLRRASAVAELVAADREASGGLPSGQSSDRIANWVREVPVGDPGPGVEV